MGKPVRGRAPQENEAPILGMGSDTHTFHLHGHRWVINGAQGTAVNANNAIPNPQTGIVSQFEDTRVLGPANSFAFTVPEGTSFMRAQPPIGEWHMHCHVMAHMMDGMMGSLLVVNSGDPVTSLPVGVPLPMTAMSGAVEIHDNFFQPTNTTIPHGGTVTWTNLGAVSHTATANGHAGANFDCPPHSTEDFHSGTLNTNGTFSHTFSSAGVYHYHCDIHGCTMAGTVTVT